jgi:hypothetical protein
MANGAEVSGKKLRPYLKFEGGLPRAAENMVRQINADIDNERFN